MKKIKQPFNSSNSVYQYLLERGLIDFSYDYFNKIMSIYNYQAKKVYRRNNPPEVINGKISKLEYTFCETVRHLRDKTIYSVYQSLYEQSLEEPDIALKFLKFYDRKEKKYDEIIKTKSTKQNINNAKDNEASNKLTIEKNMNEISSLLKNPEPPNKIHIPTDNSQNNSENDNENDNINTNESIE